MGMKYCPNCKDVVLAKALGSYSQVQFNGVPGKKRKIVHMEEDGDLMKCIPFTDQKELKEGLETGEWYLSIISRAIRPGADGKIMLHRQEVKSG